MLTVISKQFTEILQLYAQYVLKARGRPPLDTDARLAPQASLAAIRQRLPRRVTPAGGLPWETACAQHVQQEASVPMPQAYRPHAPPAPMHPRSAAPPACPALPRALVWMQPCRPPHVLTGRILL